MSEPQDDRPGMFATRREALAKVSLWLILAAVLWTIPIGLVALIVRMIH